MPGCSNCGRGNRELATPSASQPAGLRWVVKVDGQVVFSDPKKSAAQSFADANGGVVRLQEVDPS